MSVPASLSSARPAPLERLVAWLRRDPHLWLALLLAIPAMLPVFAPGYFMKAHDARHSIFFLVEFDQSFSEGAWWPVWGPDHAVGFGYPTFLLYAPLAFYIGEAAHLLGLGFAAATKVTWSLGFLLGAAGSYRLARRWFSPAVALVASLAFTYAPYHLSQIYVRAALNEFMALAWLPWAVLAFLRLWDEPGPWRAALAAAALTALMLFHTVSTLTFVPLIGALLLLLFVRESVKSRRAGRSPWSVIRSPRAGWTLVALAVAGLLSCIFFVPLLLERGYVAQYQWVNQTYDYRRHFVYPGQFLIPTWGYGYSVPGPNDGMSFQLGIPIFVLSVIGAVAVAVGFGVKRVSSGRDGPALPPAHDAPGRRLMAWFLVATTLVALFLMTPAAQAFWDSFPLVDLIQFPWRLLAVTVFTFALLAGFGACALDRPGETGFYAANPFVYVVALVLIVSSLPFARPQIVSLRPQDETPLAVLDFEMNFPDMRAVTVWSQRLPTNADSPLIAQYLAGQPLQRAAIVAGAGEILEQSARALAAQARVRADGPVALRFYTYYFPGWRATVDGRPVEIRADGPNGLIGLDVPTGVHDVQVAFGTTLPRIAGQLLSGVGVLLLAILVALGFRKSPSK
ncbi:MAG: 6-pyruvoyl-tetrahydropterin synthase-related protein [Nitrososphaerales archaeon]